jgi:uncharacterized protein (DUF983 family)
MTEPPVLDAALKGLCPRCGSKTLFAGFVRFAPRCRVCGLDLAAFNVGDGPAAFLTLIVGALVTLLAVLTELAFEPSLWVHLVLWVPLTLGLVLVTLRVAKAALLSLEYRHRAREGRIDPQ